MKAFALLCRLVYAYARRGEGDPALAKFTAALLMAMLQFFVLAATLIWIELFGGPRALTILNRTVVIAMAVAITAVNYFGVYRGNRIDRFEAEFRAWTPAQRRSGTALAGAFLALLLAYGLLAFRALLRHYGR